MSLINVLRDILASLESCGADPASVENFSCIVRQVFTAHGVTMPERDDRIAFARQLMDAQVVSHSALWRRISKQFGVSRASAYRDTLAAFRLAPYSVLENDESQILSRHFKGIPRDLVPRELVEANRLSLMISNHIEKVKK